MDHYDVIVIGGGASGMMAAGTAASCGRRVLLLEKNARLGQKLAISGGGRCNITNAQVDEHVLLSRYGKAHHFLYSAFSQFGLEDTFAFFESRGLPLKVEARERAFPVTEKASDVVRVLREYLAHGHVTVRTGAPVERINVTNNRIESVTVQGQEYTAQSYIIATGGLSHPETGSTGDGFSWLKKMGHTIMEPTPSIVPLKVRETWVKKLSGISIPDMKITFFVEGKRQFSLRGTLLFAHFGLTGPLILNAAGRVADLLQAGSVTTQIDLFPVEDLGILDRRIASTFDQHKNKLLKNVLKNIIPSGVVSTLLSLVPTIDPSTKVHSITKEHRRMIALLLKALPLTIEGLMGFDRAVVADGGVYLTEIDTKTMRSKKCNNLFIIGDLLHITRPSGGYSLQLCWTTGAVAGRNA